METSFVFMLLSLCHIEAANTVPAAVPKVSLLNHAVFNMLLTTVTNFPFCVGA